MQIFAVAVFFIAAIFGSAAHAFVPASDPSVIGWSSTVSGNVVKFAPKTIDASNVAKFDFAKFSSNAAWAIDATAKVTHISPGGGAVPVAVTQTLPKAAVSKAIVRFLGKVVTPLVVGNALYELAKEIGYTLDNSSGSLTLTKSVPDYSNVWGWQLDGPNSGWGATIEDACAKFDGSFLVQYGVPWTPPAVASGSDRCMWGAGYWRLANRAWGPAGGGATSKTIANFEADLNAQADWVPSSAIVRAAVEALRAGESISANDPVPANRPAVKQVTGPATSPGPSSTTTSPTGAVTTNNTTYNYNYGGDTITTTVTNVSPNGTTVTAPESVPAPEVEVCGLPGKSACKIDETGTPTDPGLKPQEKTNEVFQPIKDFAGNPSSVLPALPSFNWSFALPTGCTVISLPAFAPYLQGIDICQFQPMFHDIMGIVWLIGGLFGAMGMFFRNVFATV